MIKAICHTNVDEGKTLTWPTEFVALPRVGEYVKAANGLCLKIVSITHIMKEKRIRYVKEECITIEPEPMIEIELNR